MAAIPISALPAAAASASTDQGPVNQAGTTKRVTTAQLATYMETGLTKLELVSGAAEISSAGVVTLDAGAGGYLSIGGVEELAKLQNSKLTVGAPLGGTGGTITFNNGIQTCQIQCYPDNNTLEVPGEGITLSGGGVLVCTDGLTGGVVLKAEGAGLFRLVVDIDGQLGTVPYP